VQKASHVITVFLHFWDLLSKKAASKMLVKSSPDVVIRKLCCVSTKQKQKAFTFLRQII